MTIRVGSYQLFVMSVVGQSYQPPATKAFYLKPHVSYQGPFEVARVYFYPQPSAELSVRSSATAVSARIGHEHFAPMYHLLQTEEPVYMTWLEDVYFRLSTAAEPTGEGYADGPFLAP